MRNDKKQDERNKQPTQRQDQTKTNPFQTERTDTPDTRKQQQRQQRNK